MLQRWILDALFWTIDLAKDVRYDNFKFPGQGLCLILVILNIGSYLKNFVEKICDFIKFCFPWWDVSHEIPPSGFRLFPMMLRSSLSFSRSGNSQLILRQLWRNLSSYLHRMIKIISWVILLTMLKCTLHRERKLKFWLGPEICFCNLISVFLKWVHICDLVSVFCWSAWFSCGVFAYRTIAREHWAPTKKRVLTPTALFCCFHLRNAWCLYQLKN